MSNAPTTHRAWCVVLGLLVLTACLSVWPASGELEPPGPPSHRLLAQAPAGAPSAAPAAPEASTPADQHTGRRIRVTDPHTGRALIDAGHRLVATYEGFQILEVAEATAAALAGDEGVEVLQDHHVILLNTGPLDTRAPAVRRLRGPAGVFPGKRLHLVQFSAPVQASWLEAVKKTGVRVVTYIPFNAYLVYGDASSLGQLQAEAQVSPLVQWDGPYLDAYKVNPRAQAVVEAETKSSPATDSFSIQMVDDPAANAVTLALIDSLKLAPILSQSRALGYVNVSVRLPPSRLADVARQPDVVSIHLYSIPKRRDERQGQIVAGNITGSGPTGPGYLAWLAGKGFTQAQFTASGFAVDLSDDGIDDGTTAPNHFGLYVDGNIAGTSRIAYVRREPAGAGEIRGCDGHGTLNAHIVGGYNNLSGFPHTDAAGFRYGLGVAPFVRLGSSVIFDPSFTNPDYEDLQARAYADGARISSNSWGADVNGAYDSDAQRYDALVRDAQPAGSAIPTAGNQQMVIVFSAGNAGPAAGTLDSPGTAKNVLTVGASENVRSHATASGGNNAAGTDGCSIDDTVANDLADIPTFSARGPSDDGRVRPDLVAPGTHVTGGVFQTGAPGVNGTADACFDATSVCALPGGGVAGDPDNFFPQAQQFYTTSTGTSHSTPAVAGGAALVRQWFINQAMSPASPAMTKAFLMNSARYLTGAGANDTLPSPSQGMGLLDLGRAFDGTARVFRDQVDLFTATGQSFTFTGTISDPGKPFRVTVAWTDAPGSTTGNAFNNDLDLTVVAGGVVYKGNVFSGSSSVTGGAADPRNNVESVFIPAGVTGPFAVIVRAANVNSDGVPGNASPLDQDFALVVYNAVAANLPVLATQSAAVIGGNAIVEPNECNDLDIALKNWGTVTATGVSATLGTGASGVTFTQPGAAYPNIAPGATATNATPFRIVTAGGFTCGTIIPLTVTVTTGQGVQVVGLGLASGAPVPTGLVSTDVPKAIPDVSTVESTLAVSGINGAIEKVTVSFHLTHAFDGDLDISLVGPDGTTVELTSDNGASGDNYGASCGARTVFDDAAGTSITAGAAPFTGTFTPEQALAAFAGKSGAAVNGTWKLRITDDFTADVGTLQCWTLTITHSGGCAPGSGACPVYGRDFNRDAKADILWRHDSGSVFMWLLNGLSVTGTGSPGGAGLDWQIVDVGDFNGDRKADLLWRHTSGALSIWLMNGTGLIGTGSPGGAGLDWQIAGVGDFNGDGKADLLWHHTSGAIYVWFLDGLTLIGSGVLGNSGVGWAVAGVGDFNGDGKADILWRHTSGALAGWLVNGTSVIGTGSPGNVGPGWTVVTVADFNGDGKADILWRHDSGTLAVWLLNGLSLAGTGSPGGADNNYTVAAVGDINGDGRADIVWRHVSGIVYGWLLNGTNLIGTAQIGSATNDWQIQ